MSSTDRKIREARRAQDPQAEARALLRAGKVLEAARLLPADFDEEWTDLCPNCMLQAHAYPRGWEHCCDPNECFAKRWWLNEDDEFKHLPAVAECPNCETLYRDGWSSRLGELL